MIALAYALAVLACAPSVKVRPPSFQDDCDSFNSDLWSKAEWALGRGYVRAANDSASGGYYDLKLKANTWDGAEIYTPALYLNGCAKACCRCAPVAGATSALFFYQGVRAANDEIDIEASRDSLDWRICFTVWTDGYVKWSAGYHPSFDPSAGFHEYCIDWASDSIAFLVDGQNKGTYDGAGLPTDSMQIHLNCWWPNSGTALKPTSDKLMQIDSVSYTNY